MSEHNTLREEARQQQRQALKGQSPGKKLSYIFYYYKIHFLVGFFIVIAAGSLISNVLTHKTNALSVVMVNCNREVDYDSYIDEYFKTTGLDDTYEMSVDATYVMLGNNLDYQLEQKFFLATASGQVDVVIAPKAFFDAFAEMGYMQNYDDLMTDEQIETLGDALHVVKLDADHGSAEEISGIDIGKMPAVTDGHWYDDSEQPVYMGIPIESKNTAQALDFLGYIQK